MATSPRAFLYLCERRSEVLVEAGEWPRLDGRKSMNLKRAVRQEHIGRTSQES